MILVSNQNALLQMSGATRMKTTTTPEPGRRSLEGGSGTSFGCVPENLPVELGDGNELHASRAEESGDRVGSVMVMKFCRFSGTGE